MNFAAQSTAPTSLPRLIVVTGRPGTGKTTLSKALAAELVACYLRIDAVETALQVALADFGIGDLGPMDVGDVGDVGPAGYVVAHRLAASNLELGHDVVVDAVCPVPESRQGWMDTAAAAGAQLIIFETHLSDTAEHRRRVTERRPDMPGQRVPTWDQVTAGEWVVWDVERDGDRHLVDTSDAADAVASALTTITT
ncbi:AAA family ATPase [Microlunatus soli]|uniref:Predicted kinase n=1 Tax=Microlunatus soli TaxID=630515 RepID=A0A1H2ABS2_9ACTN|nr:AAA family ATPase [Microlunatus soli]SDT43327.1 Predicted kinase [Microlunatus soli]